MASNDRFWPLWRALHNGHYEKPPVMRSPACERVDHLTARRLTRSGTCHNYSVFRNSSSESVALKRFVIVSRSCSLANAFSFIAKLASTYWCVVVGLS